jgi:hypothetical protein
VLQVLQSASQPDSETAPPPAMSRHCSITPSRVLQVSLRAPPSPPSCSASRDQVLPRMGAQPAARQAAVDVSAWHDARVTVPLAIPPAPPPPLDPVAGDPAEPAEPAMAAEPVGDCPAWLIESDLSGPSLALQAKANKTRPPEAPRNVLTARRTVLITMLCPTQSRCQQATRGIAEISLGSTSGHGTVWQLVEPLRATLRYVGKERVVCLAPSARHCKVCA